MATPCAVKRLAATPRFVSLEVHGDEEDVSNSSTARPSIPEIIDVPGRVAALIPYVVAALAKEWRHERPEPSEGSSVETVQVFMPAGCSSALLRTLVGRLALQADDSEASVKWETKSLTETLQLVQVASMLQLEEMIPELINLVWQAMATGADVSELEAACQRLELPPAIQELAAAAQPFCPEPAGLPDTEQVRGMISSALHTADGKVWRVVQKVIDRREAWPRLARENAATLLAFAKGAHGSIRAMPHTGFFWGSRDFLYLVCRYIRTRPEFFDAMVTAMFEEVYDMDRELPAEVIDAVFKELLVHEGLTFTQCEHVMDKLMQRGEQMEYLFHEWSGVFPTLPAHARQALAKGLLPSIGRCPHAALDFVLKELDAVPQFEGRSKSSVGFSRGCLCARRHRSGAPKVRLAKFW